MSGRRNMLLLSALLLLSVTSTSAFVEDLDDSFMEQKQPDDIWLIKFYAPWCSFCKELDPVWHQIGSELRSLGSPVIVGKSDATAATRLAKEFQVRTYPAILMLKKDVKYNYPGPRTKDGIIDFANRVAGPLVRSLSTPQLFLHAMSRHDVMIVYVGSTSQLKGNYTLVAEKLIIHTYFFSTSRDVLPKAVSLPSLPAVVIFKDGTFFTYNEEHDGDLKLWINRERFPNFFHMDTYTLYAMGESGKLVLLALVEKNLCDESLRYKNLVEKVADDQKETYRRSFSFGFTEDTEYITGLLMSEEVVVPSYMVLNLSNDGYFLPPVPIETERQLQDFLNGVLDGSLESLGGNGVVQRVRRFVYDIKTTLAPLFTEAPVFGCILFGVPLCFGGFFCFLCCKARTDVDDDDNDDDRALLASSSSSSPLRRSNRTNKKSD